MSSWGTANFLIDGNVIQEIKAALDAYEKGEMIPVVIPPGITATYNEAMSYGQKLKRLVLTGPNDMDMTTIVSIASCFGIYGAPQRWSIMRSKNGDTYEIVVLKAV